MPRCYYKIAVESCYRIKGQKLHYTSDNDLSIDT